MIECAVRTLGHERSFAGARARGRGVVSGETKEGRDAASRVGRRTAPVSRRHTRSSPRPVTGWRQLRGGRCFTPGLRSAGGVRGSCSKRTSPVRPPAVMAPRASALMRYGIPALTWMGGRPLILASPRPPSLVRLGSINAHARSHHSRIGFEPLTSTGLRAERWDALYASASAVESAGAYPPILAREVLGSVAFSLRRTCAYPPD